jgi:tellurite resistance protein
MAFDPAASLDGFNDEQLEAVVETMYLAAAADGEFSIEEQRHLAERIGRLSHGRLRGERLGALLAQAGAALERQGRPARLRGLRERLTDAKSRRGALGMAICLMAVDGIVRTSEREFIHELSGALEIEPEEAANLVAELTRPAD